MKTARTEATPKTSPTPLTPYEQHSIFFASCAIVIDLSSLGRFGDVCFVSLHARCDVIHPTNVELVHSSSSANDT